jgi:peptide chain release factor 1
MGDYAPAVRLPRLVSAVASFRNANSVAAGPASQSKGVAEFARIRACHHQNQRRNSGEFRYLSTAESLFNPEPSAFNPEPSATARPRNSGEFRSAVVPSVDYVVPHGPSIAMRELLEQKLARFEELEQQLLDPQVLANSSRVAAAAREHGSLAKLATKYRRFTALNRQIAEALALADGGDAELRELAQAEIPELRKDREQVYGELLDMTIGGEDAARTRCVMEIRAGTGGEEAALFARDLYEMYKHYGERKGWKMEVLDLHPAEQGGFKEVILGVEGEGVYRDLRYESGGHRVQRVPQTETKGRIHTSAATVAVLPEPEDVEIGIQRDDYREDVFRASGPGGQHVNKTASAIRLTHLETGIVVQCQDGKSQHKNRAQALRVLKSRVYELYKQREQQKRASERKEQIGSGDRSERIRTYNFSENRLTDHRIGLTLYKLDNILAGNLDPVTQALIEHDRQAQRDNLGTVD